MDVFGLVERHL